MQYKEVCIKVSADKIYLMVSSLSADKPFSDDYDIEKLQLQIRVSKIFQKVLNIRRTMVKSDIEIFEKEDFIILGNMLRNILLEHKVVDSFFNIPYREVTSDESSRCRLLLEFDKNAREMAELPWEYIRYDDKFLAAHPRYCFNLIRKFTLSKDCDERAVTPPGRLNVLLVISDPASRHTRLDPEEIRQLKRVFEKFKQNNPDTFNYVLLDSPTRKDLMDEIKKKIGELPKMADGKPEPYVLHYYGHARPDAVALRSSQDNAEDADWVSDKNFAQEFDKLYDYQQPALLFLQACDSGKITNFAESRGVALQLTTHCKLPAVLAIQNEILSSISIQFMEKMYQTLLDGEDVADAVTKGRALLGDLPDEKYSNNTFGSPVLFTTTNQLIRFVEKQIEEGAEMVDKICSLRAKPECRMVQKYPKTQTVCRFCRQGVLIDLSAPAGDLSPGSQSASTAGNSSTANLN